MQGEHRQAVKSLQDYIQLCLHQELVPAEAQAFCALADCQQFLGNLEGAMQSLQAFLLKSRHHDAQVNSRADLQCSIWLLILLRKCFPLIIVHVEVLSAAP